MPTNLSVALVRLAPCYHPDETKLNFCHRFGLKYTEEKITVITPKKIFTPTPKPLCQSLHTMKPESTNFVTHIKIGKTWSDVVKSALNKVPDSQPTHKKTPSNVTAFGSGFSLIIKKPIQSEKKEFCQPAVAEVKKSDVVINPVMKKVMIAVQKITQSEGA